MFIRGGAQGLLLRKIKMEVPTLTAPRCLSLEELAKEENSRFTEYAGSGQLQKGLWGSG